MGRFVGPDEHECKADGEHGCEVCQAWWDEEMERWAELEAEEERSQRYG